MTSNTVAFLLDSDEFFALVRLPSLVFILLSSEGLTDITVHTAAELGLVAQKCSKITSIVTW